jgi:hypothetical protein
LLSPRQLFALFATFSSFNAIFLALPDEDQAAGRVAFCKGFRPSSLPPQVLACTASVGAHRLAVETREQRHPPYLGCRAGR